MQTFEIYGSGDIDVWYYEVYDADKRFVKSTTCHCIHLDGWFVQPLKCIEYSSNPNIIPKYVDIHEVTN